MEKKLHICRFANIITVYRYRGMYFGGRPENHPLQVAAILVKISHGRLTFSKTYSRKKRNLLKVMYFLENVTFKKDYVSNCNLWKRSRFENVIFKKGYVFESGRNL